MHGHAYPLAAQMAVHILAMNLIAPGLILLLRRSSAWPRASFGGVAAATIAQLAALWSMHAPGVLATMHADLFWMVLLHLLLGMLALWFWHEVIVTAGDRRWRSILALLITAKLFCLLGALMVFAPQASAASMEDQQAAGLMMLVACPITYLLAAGIIARRWLLDIEARPARPTA